MINAIILLASGIVTLGVGVYVFVSIPKWFGDDDK